MSTPVRVVLITAPSGEPAQELAKTLVTEGHAACVNRVSGIESTYVWKGELEVGNEDLLIVKTTADRIDTLKRRVQALHSYDVPEVLVLDVNDGLTPYLVWVEETRGLKD